MMMRPIDAAEAEAKACRPSRPRRERQRQRCRDSSRLPLLLRHSTVRPAEVVVSAKPRLAAGPFLSLSFGYRRLLFSLISLLCWICLAATASSLVESTSVDASAKADKTKTMDDEPDDGRGRSDQAQSYMLLGVSGTLQEGFPLRPRLDYNASAAPDNDDDNNNNNCSKGPPYVPAVFIGRALVRGFKAYLDVKDPGWREYVPEASASAASESGQDGSHAAPPPPPPRVPNAVVMATGCHEHANLYHVYAVDARQFPRVLSDEPRFLGISSDAGLVDLLVRDSSGDEKGGDNDSGDNTNSIGAKTDDTVRNLALQLVRKTLARANHSASTPDDAVADNDGDSLSVEPAVVAIPLVIGVHFRAASYVESPAAATLPDGTAVTSYAESLAKWAGVQHDDLVQKETTAIGDDDLRDNRSCHHADEGAPGTCADFMSRSAAAWDRLHQKTRSVERQRSRADFAASTTTAPTHPATLECNERVRLGVGPAQIRLNFPLGVEDLVDFV
jgi:hypothetical protein